MKSNGQQFNERLCFHCTILMKKATINYKSLELKAQQCPRCKDRIFTEDLAMKAAAQLEKGKIEISLR